jgi:hypothetical protein
MTDDKLKQDDKERDRMNQQQHSDKKVGIDRTDQAPGPDGHDREVARPHGTRE